MDHRRLNWQLRSNNSFAFESHQDSSSTPPSTTQAVFDAKLSVPPTAAPHDAIGNNKAAIHQPRVTDGTAAWRGRLGRQSAVAP